MNNKKFLIVGVVFAALAFIGVPKLLLKELYKLKFNFSFPKVSQIKALEISSPVGWRVYEQRNESATFARLTDQGVMGPVILVGDISNGNPCVSDKEKVESKFNTVRCDGPNQTYAYVLIDYDLVVVSKNKDDGETYISSMQIKAIE